MAEDALGMTDISGLETKEKGVDDLRNVVASHLVRRFVTETTGVVDMELDRARWPELDVHDMQAVLAGEGTNQEKLQRFEEFQLFQKVEQIRSAEVSGEEAALIVKMQEALEENPDLTEELLWALGETEARRTAERSTNQKKRIEGGGHLRSVVELTRDDEGKPRGLLSMIAQIHDISKYEGNGLMLMAHEHASASIAGDVMREALGMDEVKGKLLEAGALSEDEYGDYVEAVGKFAEIVVAGHGEKEFPQKMVKMLGEPLSNERGIYDMAAWGHQLYIDSYRPIEEVAPEVEDEQREVLEMICEGVRAADMAAGTWSFVKYFGETDAQKLLNDFDTSRQFVETFASSVLEYYRDMPPTLGLKESVVEDNRTRAGVMYTTMRAVENPDTLDDYKEEMVAAFGENGAKIVDEAAELDRIFREKEHETSFYDIHRSGESEADRKSRLEQQERVKPDVFKGKTSRVFERLVGALEVVDLGDLEKTEAAGLNGEVKATLADMERELGIEPSE